MILPKKSNKFTQSEILSSICHEFKTPASAILALAEILREDIDDKVLEALGEEKAADVKECIDNIGKTANELLELSRDFLDVSLSGDDDFKVDCSKEIEIEDVISRAVRLNYDYSLSKNIQIKTEIDPQIGLVKLDAKRMKQVLTNLISNALKYSDSKTEIKVLAQISVCELSIVDSSKLSAKKFLEIAVEDYGYGMSEEEINLAFEKYRIVENHHDRRVDSFGLGLPIVKRLVELQGGKIEVFSAVGEGTKVKMRFLIENI